MERFRVALCQLEARGVDEAELGLEGILRALDEAGERGAQLVALPECAYPAYYLGDADPYARPGVRPYEEVLGLLAEKARRYGYWVAAGLAVPHGPGTLTNSGVVIDPAGEVRGRYDKQFLWHFDNTWFERGSEFPVWDTGFCRFGILICADSRHPEIARSLVVNGAEVIVDLTAWVSQGRTVAELTTTQCQYMMPVRARESGVWVVAADKWGSEDGTIIYAGRSSVITPRGEVVAQGPTDRDMVVVHDIEPMTVETVPRRPSLYGTLTKPANELAGAAVLEESLVPAATNARIAVAPDGDGLEPEAIAARYRALRRQDNDIVVFPGLPAYEGWEVLIPTFEALVREQGGALVLAANAEGCAPGACMMVVTPERTLEHRATHGRGLVAGELPAPVLSTPAGNIGILCGDEGYVPEVARCLALEGADFLVWSLFEADPMAEQFARTRADENKVYVAAAWPGGGVIADPNGAPLTWVPEGTSVAVAAQVNRALARWKDRAPGTNMFRDRLPEAYGALTG